MAKIYKVRTLVTAKDMFNQELGQRIYTFTAVANTFQEAVEDGAQAAREAVVADFSDSVATTQTLQAELVGAQNILF